MLLNYLKIHKLYQNKLPMRLGVGVIVLNKNNLVFVGKGKDNPVDK